MAQEPPAPNERAAEPAEGPVDTTSLLRWCVSLLAANAWQGMGLVPDPATQKVERNLDDARLAIDAVAALADQLRPRLPDAERRQLETLLTDLRLNFMQQKERA